MRIYAVFLDPSYFFLFSPPFPFLRLLRSFSPAVALVFFLILFFTALLLSAGFSQLESTSSYLLLLPSFFFSLKQLNSPI